MKKTRMYRVAAMTAVLGLLAAGPALAAGGQGKGDPGGSQYRGDQAPMAAVMEPGGPGGGGPGAGGGGSGGPPEGHGPGGGEDESAGNNLSYPVLWSEDGYGLTLRGTMLEPAVGTTTSSCTEQDGDAYDQREEANTWQAENALVAGNQVTTVDWGDALEATDLNSKMQRIETSLYSALAEPMTGYAMCKTNELTGVGELWGAVGSGQNLTEVDSDDAMVYTAGARLTIQRIVPDRDYTWDATAHQWVGCGADDPVFNMAVHERTSDGPGTFGVEVTVSGKITYGLVLRTDALPTGEYRLTFSLDGATGDFPGSGTSLANATIAVPEEETVAELVAAAAEEEEGGAPGANTAVMRGDLNLTYIDTGLGTRTDPLPTCPTTPPPATGGGGGTAPAAPAPTAPTAETAAPGPETPTVVTPPQGPQAATALIAQNAKITAKKSGRYPVGKVIVLTKRPVYTDAGVTVRWRATKASQDNCEVTRVAKGSRMGRVTVTLTDPGRCRVIGWAPAPSPQFEPFTVARTYRVIR